MSHLFPKRKHWALNKKFKSTRIYSDCGLFQINFEVSVTYLTYIVFLWFMVKPHHKPLWFMIKPHTSEIRMTYKYIQVTYRWLTSTYDWHTDNIRVHTSDIRITYEYIRVTYEWYTSTYEWHTDDIRVHTSYIRMTYECIRVTCWWHTSSYEYIYFLYGFFIQMRLIYLILYQLTKFQRHIFLQDIKQNVLLSSYLHNWWRHKV